MADLKWYGGRRTWEIRAAIADIIEAAAAHIVRKIKADINTPYPPASRPHEPPHKRTGRLRAAVGYRMNRKTLEANIGVAPTAPYWYYLEFGTSHMEPRPFLRTNIVRHSMAAQRRIEREAAKATRRLTKSK